MTLEEISALLETVIASGNTISMQLENCVDPSEKFEPVIIAINADEDETRLSVAHLYDPSREFTFDIQGTPAIKEVTLFISLILHHFFSNEEPPFEPKEPFPESLSDAFAKVHSALDVFLDPENLRQFVEDEGLEDEGTIVDGERSSGFVL